MKRGVRLARHRLFCLLLVGLLLCCVSPLTAFAQDENATTETETVAQTEDSDGADVLDETEESDGEETEESDEDETEESDEDASEADASLDAENEEIPIALTAFAAAADISAPDAVNNMDELEIWLAENPQGGTITLGADIEITEPVRLYLCRVEAESALVLPPNVTLDTCIVSPYISGGTVVSRKISGIAPLMPLLLYPGEVPAGFFSSQQSLCNITLTAEGVADTSEKAYFLFDDSGVDYNKPGTYKLRGTLIPPHDEFDLVAESSPLTLTVTFYDPDIPYFYGFYQDPSVFMINYYYSGNYDLLKLWRSDDGGKSWYVYWKHGDADSEKFSIVYEYDSFHLIFPDRAELSAPTLFVFEVGKGVGSDILYVDTKTIKSVGTGGDRDSGDRILLPWELFFGNGVKNNSGGKSGNLADDADPLPNAVDKNPATKDETDNQSLGGSDSSGGGGNSKHGGGNGHAGNNIPVSVMPLAENPGALLPAKTVPLDVQSTVIASPTAIVSPEPVPEQPSSPSPLFPVLAAGLTGAGGLDYVFRKRRVKSPE